MSDYLSEKALDGLKEYKYSACDKSLLSKYVMKPYWTWFSEFFPSFVAPNLITLTGFVFILINFFTVVYFIPDLIGPGPSWIYFSFALGLHLYSTFDNVDGMQARKTKSSSPLGELFDHGVDSLNCCFSSVIQGAALGLGHSWRTLAIAFLTMGSFYPVTWEHYHTGTLQLGIINGPTEGILIGTIMMVISGIYGPQIYQQNARVIGAQLGLPGLEHIPNWWTISDIFIFGMVLLLFFFQYPLSLYTVYADCRKKGTSFAQTLKGLPINLLFFALSAFWIASPDSVVLKGHVGLFIIAFGLLFARLVSKVLLAHVTLMHYPYFSVQLIPFVFGALNANARLLFGVEPYLKGENEVLFIWGCLIFNALAYYYWAHRIINAFCNRLKIRAFVIPNTSSSPSPSIPSYSPASPSSALGRRGEDRGGRGGGEGRGTGRENAIVEKRGKED